MHAHCCVGHCKYCEYRNNRLEEISSLISKGTIFPKESIVDKKRPYKCPVCDGVGEKPELLCGNPITLAVMPPRQATKQCHACEGKGIVWG